MSEYVKVGQNYFGVSSNDKSNFSHVDNIQGVPRRGDAIQTIKRPTKMLLFSLTLSAPNCYTAGVHCALRNRSQSLPEESSCPASTSTVKP